MELRVLQLWDLGNLIEVTPISSGLLNQTYCVEASGKRFILQKVNPIFSPQVNLDIDALTKHLATKKIAAPHLVKTRENKLWGNFEGAVWRMFSFVYGENYSKMKDARLALQAGQIVGDFHNAVSDFNHKYHFSRGQVHDTAGHIRNLHKSIQVHIKHELIGEVLKISEKIDAGALSLIDFSGVGFRHSHGDLKLNNLIFTNDNSNGCLVDLDTIGLMPWPLEMGDAFRSWCNINGEDDENTFFNEKIFEASLNSYAQKVKHLLDNEEKELLIEGISIIPLELSSRFLRDVLEESYFHFDNTRFKSRAAHNLVRAKGQLSLYCDIQKKKARLSRIIEKAFA